MKTSISVNKHILKLFPYLVSGILLAALPIKLWAQQNSKCIQAFEQAQINYKNGKVFKVLQLEECANKLPLYLKDEAYYLLFKSYVLTGQDSMATLSMQKLLHENPSIDPKNEDAKFRYYYQKYESKPSEIGLLLGQNINTASIPVSSRTKGFTLGIVHNHLLFSKLLLFKNLLYSERANIMEATSGPYEIPGTWIGENHLDAATAKTYGVDPKNYPTQIYHLSGSTYPSFIEGATGLKWIVFSKKRFQFFVMGGLAVNYLFENTFGNGEIYTMGITYADNGNGSLIGTPNSEFATSLSEARDAEHKSRVNAHYLGGAGIRVNINKGIVFFETRFQKSIFPQKVEFLSNSDNFSEIIGQFNHKTLDFQTQTLTFSAGYLFRIQNFRRLRQ